MKATFRERNIVGKDTQEKLFPVDLLLSGYINTLRIKQCGLSELREGSSFERPRDRKFHILIITISGKGRFLMEDGTEFTLSEGELFFSISTGQGHRHWPEDGTWKLCWFQIREDASWLMPFTFDYSVKKCECTDEIVSCMESIIDENITKNEDYSTIQNLQSQLLFRYLRRVLNISARSSHEAACIFRFNELWNEIYRSPAADWNTERIADFMNMSRAQSNRLCQKYFGTSPAEKAREIKLTLAYSLLYNLDYSVAHVAEVIGYDSVPAFSVAFSRMFGITPREATSNVERYVSPT